MPTIEAFQKGLDVFDSRVSAVGADAWAAQSPCVEWTAGDVTRHVIRNMRGLELAINGGDFFAATADDADHDLVVRWRQARLRAENALKAVKDLPDLDARKVRIGDHMVPLLAHLVEGLMRDTVIHSWDLARAVGGDERLPADAVAAATAAMANVSEAMRASGSYGAVVPVPEDADPLTQLLALAGRRA